MTTVVASSGSAGRVRAWIGAARLRTLPAAVAPVAVGVGSAHAAGAVAWGPAIAALVGAILIQIGTNFANDVFDAEKGADTPDRKGPVRAVAAGLISARAMKAAMIATFLRRGAGLVVADLDEQFRQAPCAHQCLLQFGQRDMQNLALHVGRAQPGVGPLPSRYVQGECRGVQPEQHVGEVVQQGRFVDDRGVVVQAVDGKGQGESGGSVRALEHTLETLQGNRKTAQPVFDRRETGERVEERRNAQQHQGGCHRFGVGHGARRSPLRHHPQHVQHHERVGPEGLTQHVCIHSIFIGCQLRNGSGRTGLHGKIPLLRARHPAGDIPGCDGNEREFDNGGHDNDIARSGERYIGCLPG